jgi:tetratricopeptide (TPR) repeat protein
MKTKKLISVIYLTIFLVSCNEVGIDPIIDTSVYEKHCIEYRDSAYNYLIGNFKNKDLHLGLELYDKAIQCDSNYYLAYHEKLGLLIIMGDYKDAICQMDEIVKMFKINTYQLYEERSNLYKLMNQKDSALFYSDKAYTMLINEVNIYRDSIPILTDWILYTSAKKGKLLGKSLADSLVTVHSNSKALKAVREIILDIDSTKYRNTGMFY